MIVTSKTNYLKTYLHLLYSLLCLWSILFPATASAQSLRIHEVQGNGNSSPFIGQIIQLDTSVVTFATGSFAYIQDADGDGDPTTSEGLLIDGGNTFQLVPGDRVLVSGRVEEDGGQTLLGSSISINKLSSGTPLNPTPFEPGNQLVNGVSPLERYEGMLLDFSVTVGGPTDGFGTPDVYAGADRPFREPGLLTPGQPGLPIYDGNPELMTYDPNGLGQSNFLFHNAYDQIEGIGILEQFSFGYELSPIAPTNVVLGPFTTAVRSRTDSEVTVASLNALFLLEDEENYSFRLTKVVNYIAQLMQFPDVIALQEIGGAGVIEDLIFRLRQIDPVRGDYRGFSPLQSGFLELGFLVSRRFSPPSYSELGTGEFFSGGGFLHNRDPLLMELQLEDANETVLQVLNLHIRSLNGVDDDPEVRQRRSEQAISIANMVEDLRDDNLIIVGDYNAFQFTDGYVDVYNQISGLPSLGAEVPIVDIVNPPLQSAADLLPEDERYSFVFQGSAQQLDHCLHNELNGLTVTDFQFARGNADASINYESNAVQLPRASDHDGFVFYLDVDAISSTTSMANEKIELNFPNPARVGDIISYKLLPAGSSIVLTNQLGQAQLLYGSQSSNAINNTATDTGSLQLPTTLARGAYWLSVRKDNTILVTKQLFIQ